MTSSIIFNKNSPKISFAAKQIEIALKTKKYNPICSHIEDPISEDGLKIVLINQTDEKAMNALNAFSIQEEKELQKEGFSIRVEGSDQNKTLFVLSNDSAGVMYGGFELAEQLTVQSIQNISNETQNPYMAMRGVKQNIPLDFRSPSYTDKGDAVQENIPEMWNMEYWIKFIDNLALSRYNFISLWNLHPFPSMVKVPEYPDIALDDVKRAPVFGRTYYGESDYGTPQVMDNLEIVIEIGINEKIEFWKKVMAYGRDRNVFFYILTWNIHTCGTDGKYGIDEDFLNETTKDYFRKSVKQLILTYPDLAGIGITVGENIKGATFQEKEDWAFDSYGKGILDALEEQPEREFKFIHRQHEGDVKIIEKTFKPLIENRNIDFVFSYKYAQAHSYSSVKQIPGSQFTSALRENPQLKTIWTIRNDGNYIFSFGGPDFIRDYIKNIPYDISQGYYYGSDGWVWGRDFISKYPEKEYQLDIEKHWYSWLLWGRLGYDPDLNNKRLTALIVARYPHANISRQSDKLFTAWQEASMIYPVTTGFHWGVLDFRWYPEACASRSYVSGTYSGFHDVYNFINHPTHPGTDYLTIPDYVEAEMSGKDISGTTPIEISEMLHNHSDNALSIVNGFDWKGDFELWKTVEDIRSMAYQGKYYAHKIKAATAVAMFRASYDKEYNLQAVKDLQMAAYYWRVYVSLLKSQYHTPVYMCRVNDINWIDLYQDVLRDIINIGGEVTLKSMAPTAGGVILEAEEGITNTGKDDIELPGHTGSGFISFNQYRDGSKKYVEWNYTTPERGTYLLEFRYASIRPGTGTGRVNINNKQQISLQTWSAGTINGNWVWDRIVVTLNEGENIIRYYPDNHIHLDHVNIIYIGI
jgi:hypothetical protein